MKFPRDNTTQNLFARETEAIESELTPEEEKYLFYADVGYHDETQRFLLEAPSQKIATHFLREEIGKGSTKILRGVTYSFLERTYADLEREYPGLREVLIDYCNAVERGKPPKDRKIIIDADTSESRVEELLNDVVGTKIISLRPIGGTELTQLIQEGVEFDKIFSVSPDIVGSLRCKTMLTHSTVPCCFEKYTTKAPALGLPVSQPLVATQCKN